MGVNFKLIDKLKEYDVFPYEVRLKDLKDIDKILSEEACKIKEEDIRIYHASQMKF